ncbi:hypothetical protein [Dysgonomonas sp. 25]|uniref:hypothetical protein n=1 Tax=Dysgonomonas sp. 25 TaxID=2302933 RepID=UPI0013D6DBEB|nr:hypothetical protein [Dysgonomonas sp. 25]NDV69690.1 hypothetical protein [Dysgonomonas sp. 25]
MKKYEKVLLDKSQRRNYYLLAQAFFLLAMIPIFIIIADWLGLLSESASEDRKYNLIYLMTIPMLTVAIYDYIRLKRALRYKILEITCSTSEFKETLKRTIRELDLLVEINENGYFKAYSNFDFMGVQGFMITVIRKEDKILFNSILDPNRYTLSATWGRNRRNYQIFLKNLRDVLKGEPAKRKPEKIEKEWSAKRILIRLISYPFCIFLIGLGIYSLLSPINWKSGLVGIGVISFASFYLYMDLKVIIRDYRKKKWRKNKDFDN